MAKFENVFVWRKRVRVWAGRVSGDHGTMSFNDRPKWDF